MPANFEQHNSVIQLPTLADLKSEYIAEAAREAGEPEWLIQRRTEAWDFFAQAAPPEWRRTNLKRLQPADINPLFRPQGTSLLSDNTLSQQGVVFSTLHEALHTHEDIIRERLGSAIEPLSHKFSALRAALWQDGVFLYVPRNAEVELPLRVRYALADDSKAIFPYTLVVLEANARVTFIEEYLSRDVTETALVGPTTEIFAGPGSDIRYVTAQRGGAGIHHIGGQMLVLDRDANSTWVSVALGSQVQHIEAESRMQGDGCRVNWLGVTFANAEQQLLSAPWLRHIGANTESNMDFKTVVTAKGYSVFDGMIKIEHGSRATTTRLEEHAVHLTPTSRSDSIPGLKIDTNDVASAGHASTSGQVDEDQLFYMQTRGIDRTEAKRLIVMGLFEPALAAIPVDELRDELSTAIEAKI
jgi:Fe-S cluster assembly protein SufD